jgi:hypothetical protein
MDFIPGRDCRLKSYPGSFCESRQECRRLETAHAPPASAVAMQFNKEATKTIECCTWDKTSVIAGPADSLKGEWSRPRSNTLRHPSHLCFLSFLLFPTASLRLKPGLRASRQPPGPGSESHLQVASRTQFQPVEKARVTSSPSTSNSQRQPAASRCRVGVRSDAGCKRQRNGYRIQQTT